MQAGNNGDPLVMSMNQVLNNLRFEMSSSCCIYRVPKRLRRVSENAYTPQVVSIGPLHQGKESLKPMEELKHRYLKVFLKRTQGTVEDLIKVIRKEEIKMRSCYAGTINLSSDEFVRIILVDSVFIIEVLLRFYDTERREDNDRIFSKPYMLQDVWPDMRMLENQLPFFILHQIFEPHKDHLSGGKSMLYLSHHFFKKLMHIEVYADQTFETIKPNDVAHFIDLVRKLYPIPPTKLSTKPPRKPPTESPEAVVDMATESPEAEVDTVQGGTLATPSMTQLFQAGVKFQEGSTTNMFDVEFKHGVLKMPKLTISDQTEVTVTNLQAFEHSQCKDKEKYINDYFFFVNCLVKTPQDVSLLVKYKMLDNKLGDNKKGFTLIKNLVNGAVESKDHFYFITLCDDLNKYYNTGRHQLKEFLFKHFLYSPWATKEIIAAVIFLFLTLVQTVFSMMSYFHDTKKNSESQ